jgi:hypothetical protein
MDQYTLERYPDGIPWKERPGYHTAEMLRRDRELRDAITRMSSARVDASVHRLSTRFPETRQQIRLIATDRADRTVA